MKAKTVKTNKKLESGQKWLKSAKLCDYFGSDRSPRSRNLVCEGKKFPKKERKEASKEREEGSFQGKRGKKLPIERKLPRERRKEAS